jgi:hypothetical protein
MAFLAGWRSVSELGKSSMERQTVEDAAKVFVESYGTTGFTDDAAYRGRLLSVSGGSLGQAVAASSPDPAAQGQERRTHTRVISVELIALTSNNASVLVTAKQTREFVSPSAGIQQESMLQKVGCKLAREDARWLVVEYRLLAEEAVHSAND